MLVTTTHSIQGRTIRRYLGVCASHVIVGTNVMRDMFASMRDVVGGHVVGYENALADATRSALNRIVDQAEQLGANAIVGTTFGHEALGQNGSILMVAITGTAVELEQTQTDADRQAVDGDAVPEDARRPPPPLGF